MLAEALGLPTHPHKVHCSRQALVNTVQGPVTLQREVLATPPVEEWHSGLCSSIPHSRSLKDLMVPCPLGFLAGEHVASSKPPCNTSRVEGGGAGRTPPNSHQNTPEARTPASPLKEGLLPLWKLRTFLVMGCFSPFFHKHPDRVTDQLVHSLVSQTT